MRPNPTRFFGLNPFLGWKNGLSRVELSPQGPNSGWNGGGLRFYIRTYFWVEPASTRQLEIEKKARIWKVESIKSTFLVWRCKNRSGRVVESIYYHQFCEQYISGSCCHYTLLGKVRASHSLQLMKPFNWLGSHVHQCTQQTTLFKVICGAFENAISDLQVTYNTIICDLRSSLKSNYMYLVGSEKAIPAASLFLNINICTALVS